MVAILALPAVLMLPRVRSLRIAGAWLAVFLLLQTILSGFLTDDFKVNSPFLRTTISYRDGALNDLDGDHVITTDGKGFRANPRVDYGKASGLRVFAIGASTTEQIAIADELTWTHLLQEKLKSELRRPAEVVNTGVLGTRMRHHLATFQEILRYDPDVVVFLLGGNDAIRHIEIEFGSRQPDGFTDPMLPRRSLLGRIVERVRSSLLGTPFVPADRISQYQGQDGKSDAEPTELGHWFKDRHFHEREAKALERAVRHEFFPKEVSGPFRESLAELASACRRSSVRCVWITQPAVYALDLPQAMRDRLWMTPATQAFTVTLESMVHLYKLYAEEVRAVARSNGLSVCDAYGAMSARVEYFYDDVHYNVAGSRAMAEVVFSCLKGLLEPASARLRRACRGRAGTSRPASRAGAG